MRRRLRLGILMAAVLFSVSACAELTTDLRAEHKNGAQFASWQHMGYSLFRATPKKTTKDDLVAARQEKWWGEVVRVAPMM
jgi:hypothetical protein